MADVRDSQRASTAHWLRSFRIRSPSDVSNLCSACLHALTDFFMRGTPSLDPVSFGMRCCSHGQASVFIDQIRELPQQVDILSTRCPRGGNGRNVYTMVSTVRNPLVSLLDPNSQTTAYHPWDLGSLEVYAFQRAVTLHTSRLSCRHYPHSCRHLHPACSRDVRGHPPAQPHNALPVRCRVLRL